MVMLMIVNNDDDGYDDDGDDDYDDDFVEDDQHSNFLEQHNEPLFMNFLECTKYWLHQPLKGTSWCPISYSQPSIIAMDGG